MIGESSLSLRHRLACLFWVFLLGMGVLAVYELQIAETNAYMGYLAFSIDVPYAITATISLLFLGMVFAVRTRKPSDFFCLFYGLFVLLPYIALYKIRGDVDFFEYTMGFCVLMFPLPLLVFATHVAPALRLPVVFRHESVVWLIVLLCIIGVLNAFSTAPDLAGFGFSDSYDRRLQGRDMYPDGSFSAYLNSAIVNGFAPLLAFVAGWRSRKSLFLCSLVCVVAYYYLVGLKAPFVFALLSFLVGRAAREGWLELTGKAICGLLLGFLVIFMIEYALFGFSYVGDYFFRRVYGVSAFIIAAYFDFISHGSASAFWSLLEGIDTLEPVTFVVGEQFLGAPGLNANTNTFLHKLAEGGLVMYCATVFLVFLVFLVLDAAYKSKRNPILLYLGFLYAILLTEQAATIALVSSGTGFLILVFLFSGEKSLTTRSLSHGRVVAS